MIKSDISFNGDYMCQVAIPNREISLVYNKEIIKQLDNFIPQGMIISLQEAIYTGDNDKFKEIIQMILIKSTSSFDTIGENFYHGFMLGLCAMFGGTYITSNKESGVGRYDIQLKPVDKKMPGVLIELKYGKECTEEQLIELSKEALQQIIDKRYDTEMKTEGVEKIYKYGVAFSGKKVEVQMI